MYPRPALLWLIWPILIYWVARILVLAHRRHLDDAPILFAVKDRNSLLAFLLVGLIMLVAGAKL